MTIEEMRITKKATEQAISDLLNAFAYETGMAITSVDVGVVEVTKTGSPDRETIIGQVRIVVE